MILVGIFISGLRQLIGFHENSFMLLLGSLFIAAYFYKDSYGLLIPGCIIFGLGLSSAQFGIVRNYSQFNTVGLGIGFIGIFVIDLINKGKTHWWPLIPGGILTIIGLSSSPFNLWKMETCCLNFIISSGKRRVCACNSENYRPACWNC